MPSMAITASKRSSLLSTNYTLLSSSRLSLVLAVILAAYPQYASAAPGNIPRDVRRSRKGHANSGKLVDQLDAQPAVTERRNRRRRKDINRRTSFQDLAIAAWNQLANSGNVNAQGVGDSNNPNNPNNDHHSPSPTPPRNQIPTSSPSKTTTTTKQTQPTSTPVAAATSPVQSELSSSHANSSSESDDTSDATTNTQTQTSSPPSGPLPSGGNNPALSQNHPTGSGQPQSWSGGPYHDPGENSTASIATGGTNAYNQSGVNKGLVAGLVISLVILLAFCALAAFFVIRRMRKKRREREDISSFNDTAPWLGEKKRHTFEIAETEKTETRDGTPESSLSRVQSISSESRMRARTPGGSSAVPVPYDPSEVSDDVSAHFTFFPQDDAIGVPVPYPLALHVPARVAQAMADRDARWLEYEELRRQQIHARSSSMASTRTPSDIVTIPDRPDLSRRTTQRSTTDSLMSYDTSMGVHYAPSHHQSEYGMNRSDVGVYGHDDHRSQHAADGRESLLSVADFPIPPPPVSIRPQSWRIRRASAAPSQLRSVSENPFATAADLASTAEMEHLSDEGTATQHGDSHRMPMSTVAGTTTERVQTQAGITARPSDNPFDDITHPTERRLTAMSATTQSSSIRESEVYAGVIEHQTVDGHDSLVFAFPAPPKPARHPS